MWCTSLERLGRTESRDVESESELLHELCDGEMLTLKRRLKGVRLPSRDGREPLIGKRSPPCRDGVKVGPLSDGVVRRNDLEIPRRRIEEPRQLLKQLRREDPKLL